MSSVTTHFKKLIYCLNYLTHPAVFTSDAECVLAAGPRTEAGDATDQWRDYFTR